MKDQTQKIKLSNGLTVILEQNSHAKIISLNVGVKVGSFHETPSESGLCHLIEHMVFKGTPSYKAGEIATTVEAHGGELNAYTSLDQTVYYINLPSPHATMGLKILKEMVFEAEFDPNELALEKEVVVEEILRGKDQPQRVLNELVFEKVFQNHAYGKPVIGTDALVRGFSPQMIRDFYRQHYVPSNMILGVCGDFEPEALLATIRALFEPIKDKPRRDFTNTKIEPNAGCLVVKKGMPLNTVSFDWAFSAVAMNHPDAVALDALSHFLGEGGASLLEQNTKEKEGLVQYIYSASFTPRQAGVFFIGAQTEPKNLEAAIHSVLKQIRHIQTIPVTEDELLRVKRLAQSQLIFDKQTCEGTAKKWMSYETTVDDYAFDEKYMQAFLALTPEVIRQVAQKYLTISASVLGILHPVKVKPKLRSQWLQPFKKETPPYRFKRNLGDEEAGLYELKNGLKVIVKENHRLPLFSFKLVALGGLRFETKANNGWSQLMTSVLSKSFGDYNQKTIAEKCESMAIGLSAYSGRNSMGASLSSLSQNWQESLDFACEMVTRPHFETIELQKEKKLQLEAIKNRKDNPAGLAFYHNLKSVFGAHPYALSSIGELPSLNKATSNDLTKMHQRFWNISNSVVAVVGAVKTDLVLKKLNEALFAYPQGSRQTPKPLKHAALKAQTQNIYLPKNQSHLVLGFVGASLLSEDRYALEVLNHIFSGQGGRLFLELRDKQSLAYSVSSHLIEGLDLGYFGFYIGTEPSKTKKAFSGIQTEISKIRDQRVGEKELERAKNYILGNYAFDHQKNSDFAMEYALQTLYQKPDEGFLAFEKKIRSVTAEKIRNVANKYLDLSKSATTVVGPK